MRQSLRLLQVRIPPPLAKALKVHAAKHEITITEFVISAVTRHLREQQRSR